MDESSELDSSKLEENLDWKYGQRSNPNELVGRGIVSNEYFEVIRGDKDINDAEKEKANKFADTSLKFDRMLKHSLRPSADDLEMRGLAPKGSLNAMNDEEYNSAMEEYSQQKNEVQQKLEIKYEQRMQPSEAIARNIIESDMLEKVKQIFFFAFYFFALFA